MNNILKSDFNNAFELTKHQITTILDNYQKTVTSYVDDALKESECPTKTIDTDVKFFFATNAMPEDELANIPHKFAYISIDRSILEELEKARTLINDYGYDHIVIPHTGITDYHIRVCICDVKPAYNTLTNPYCQISRKDFYAIFDNHLESLDVYIRCYNNIFFIDALDTNTRIKFFTNAFDFMTINYNLKPFNV